MAVIEPGVEILGRRVESWARMGVVVVDETSKRSARTMNVPSVPLVLILAVDDSTSFD